MSGYVGKYGVSPKPASAGAYKGHSFVSADGVTILEGSGEAGLLSGDLPSATPGNKFLIKVNVLCTNDDVASSFLDFRLVVDGIEISTGTLSVQTGPNQSEMFTMSERADSTTGLVEVLWTYTATTPGAAGVALRATLLIEEVSP